MEIEEKYNIGKAFNPFTLKWGSKIEMPSTRKMTEYGNRVYNRYPARSVFLIPRAILSHYVGQNLRVLDPFMGSGTTAVETILSGNNPCGTEMDPFARMVAEASCSVYNENELTDLTNLCQTIISNWHQYPQAPCPDLKGIAHWFKEEDYSELLQLRACIDDLTPTRFTSFILVTFADCLKPVSLMERQSTKPYISTKYAKVTKKVEESFLYSFEAHFNAIKEMSALCQKRPIEWMGFDATDFDGEKESIDIAITSPPYINALDYTRCIKVESAMCGKTDDKGTDELRRKQVGHEVRRHQKISDIVLSEFQQYYDKIALVDKKRADTCFAYFNDLYKNLICVHRVLKNNSFYHMIIGDNTIRKIDIPTHEIIAKLAEHVGYKWVGYYKYSIKDHRTSIPRKNEKSKIEYEHVIMLQK